MTSILIHTVFALNIVVMNTTEFQDYKKSQGTHCPDWCYLTILLYHKGVSMNKLSEVELRSLDLKLFDYQQIDRKIAIRKLEIQTETSDDCNVGGGKANTISKPTENVIARWSSDVRINGLEQLRSAIESTLDALDDELKKIFYLRWSRGSVNTWEEIADMLHVSRKSIYRKRERILTIFADFRGDS